MQCQGDDKTVKFVTMMMMIAIILALRIYETDSSDNDSSDNNGETMIVVTTASIEITNHIQTMALMLHLIYLSCYFAIQHRHVEVGSVIIAD